MELDTAAREGRKLSPDDMTKLAQEIGQKTDNIFGQMVYDNLSMKRGFKDAMRVMIGFPGWNIGSFTDMFQATKGVIRTIGQGGQVGADLLHGRKPSWEALPKSERLSLEFYMGTVVVMALAGAITQRMLTGAWPTDAKDLMMPQTGALLPNGQPERMRYPTYMRDVLSMNHPIEMVKHKLNIPLRMFAALTDNQDYFGEQIRDPWASTGEQIGQTSKYLAKNLLPFGIQGMIKTENPAARALNAFGVTPVPRQYTNSPAGNIIDEYNKMTRASVTTKESAAIKSLKNDLTKLAQAQDTAGFEELASQSIEEGKITRQQVKEVVKESQEPAGLSRFSKLPMEWKLRTLKVASDYEKEQWTPYFLKSLMQEAKTRPENLVKNRDALVSTLDEMGYSQEASLIQGLEIPEQKGKMDLSGLGVKKERGEMGSQEEIGAALQQILSESLQKLTVEPGRKRNVFGGLPSLVRRKKPNPMDVLGTL